MSFNNWDNGNLERAIELRKDGKSARQIAIELGCTRNAVIGKLGRASIEPTPLKVKPPRYAERRNRIVLLHVTTKDVDFGDAPTSGVALVEAKPGDCRWPFGDPHDLDSFRFCGRPVAGGRSYCAGHALRAFRCV